MSEKKQTGESHAAGMNFQLQTPLLGTVGNRLSGLDLVWKHRDIAT